MSEKVSNLTISNYQFTKNNTAFHLNSLTCLKCYIFFIQIILSIWTLITSLKYHKFSILFPTVLLQNFTEVNTFLKISCPFWLSLLFSFFFCHQEVHLIHLVFRWTRELNPHSRTMAQTVSPWRSPLDQGASPKVNTWFLNT